MHPFIHAFTPAIDPPWETASDYDTFVALSKVFSRLARQHIWGTQRSVAVSRCCATHQGDKAARVASCGMETRWCEPIPG